MMKRTKMLLRNCALALISALCCNTHADPTFITTTFSSGNEGWLPDKWLTSTVGGLTPGNPYLNMAADGSGEIGKVVTFNQDADWTGNYITTGVTGLRLDIINRSSSDVVYLRVLVGNNGNPQQSGGTWFLTQTPVIIPVQSEWTHVFLPLAETDMGKVGNLMGQVGMDSYEETFSDIKAIRIMSAFSRFSVIGDEFLGDVGIDNVALVPEPSTIPLIGLGGLIMYYGRRRRCKRISGRCREIELPKEPADMRNSFLSDDRF